MITVFTPTYNRKKELNNLYKSLLEQDFKDFEWLIVDDGSNDNTKDFVGSIKKDKKIKINYIYKENGGKQSAYNVGLDNAKGDIFLCIDSDDFLTKNALKRINSDYTNLKDNKIAGIIYLNNYIDKKEEIVGTSFPSEDLITTHYDLYNKYKVKGDKLFTFKTSIIKNYRFPIIEGEKFVPEALLYNRISQKYLFMCKNFVAASVNYLENGYSSNYFNLVRKNPKGNRLYYKELLEIDNKLYNVYAYILFSFYSKVKFKDILNDSKCKFKVLLLYIPVYIIYKIRG